MTQFHHDPRAQSTYNHITVSPCGVCTCGCLLFCLVIFASLKDVMRFLSLRGVSGDLALLP